LITEERLSSAIQHASKDLLGPNDEAFLSRVFSGGLRRYISRLNALGMSGIHDVLDAGCGFGQWSLALAALNQNVHACDFDGRRIKVLEDIARLVGLHNVCARVGSVESLPYGDGSMDAVFCYSVLMMSDWKRALEEFFRVLRPGGVLYIGGNDIGWYLRLYEIAPNATDDYDPQMVAIDALRGTLEYERSGKAPAGGSVVIPSAQLLSVLAKIGFEDCASAEDGYLDLPGRRNPLRQDSQMLPGSYRGLPACYEVIAYKRK
jgi:SAM-dependent methyltransferase